MKKIIVGMFSLALLLVAQNAFAATWNGASNDCHSLSIVNATTNQGYQNPCWPLSSVSVDAGQTINVRIYYHNTGTVTATNTRLILTPSTSLSSTGTTKSFTGRIVSDQGSLSFGPVNANLTSAQSLTFYSSKWYTNNTSETLTPLLSGQDGSEVLGGGLDIGSIAQGWATQGSLVVAFKVSNNQPAQVCTDSSATNYNISYPCTYPQQVCKDPSATNYNISYPCTYRQNDMTGNIIASPQNCTIASGNSTCAISFTWSTQYPVGVSSVTHDNQTLANGNNNTKTFAISNGSQSYYLYNSSILLDTATVSASCASGTAWNGSYCASSVVNNCVINNFTASPTSISYGGSSTLVWNTTNCQSVTISNLGYSVPTSGSGQVSPTGATTYVLNAVDINGFSQTSSVRVDVTSQQLCQDPFARNYRVSFPCSYGQQNQQLCQDYSALNYHAALPCYYQQQNQQICRDSSARNYLGLLPCTYQNNYPQLCQDTTATNYRGLLPCNYAVVTANKNVVTTVATNITTNSAQVNGYITNSTYYNNNTYFEYGTSVNMGSRTNAKSTIGNSNMNDMLTGLSSGTIYYFRAVGEGPDGVSKGSIEIFRTLSNAAPRPVIIQGKTVIGTSSPILLSITNRFQAIGAGDLVDYTVTYKNIGKVKLFHPMVQVILPTNITLINSSRGTYAVDTHTLSAQIEDLNPGQDGVIFLQGKVDSVPMNNSQIATTAILIYTSANGSQENAMAYVINTPRVVGTIGSVLGDATSVLGGAALFGGFFSIGLIGWLIIILIILIIILIARSAYNKNPNETVIHNNPTH